MTAQEGLKLVRQYIFDRKGKRINSNDRYILSDTRQLKLLERAAEEAVRWYRTNKK